MSNSQSDEPFLARWSRRKRGDVEETTAPSKRAIAEAPQPPEAVPEFDVASLPKIDELTADSDLAVFFQRGVPDLLKQQALRRMWTLDPAIRDFVEMAENQYDWNTPGAVPGFGELAPGTNVASLLDQALGNWPGAKAADPLDVAAQAAQDASHVQAADEPKPAGNEPLTVVLPAQPAEAVETPAIRHRHGSALPA